MKHCILDKPPPPSSFLQLLIVCSLAAENFKIILSVFISFPPPDQRGTQQAAIIWHHDWKIDYPLVYAEIVISLKTTLYMFRVRQYKKEE